MGENERKNEMILSPAEAAGFLRRLADQLDQGEVEIGNVAIETDGTVKVKQSIKTKPEKVSFKLKMKYEKYLPVPAGGPLPEGAEIPDGDEDDDESSEGGRPKYKSLKKRMSKPWKGIKTTLEAGQLPDLALVQVFVADCDLMVSYPGKGDPYYDEFSAAASELLQTVEGGDIQGAVAACQKLGDLKSRCHDEFK